ncbi:MAG: type III-A CRISPR-associated protein Csm2 [Bacilli bacterium]|nr:type III-A CRISPR-associated protein Csm2 [Bacilli bacterium]
MYKKYFKDRNVSILEYQGGDNMDDFIQQVEKFVVEKGTQLSKTQLRNIYDKILNADDLISLKMIRPQLAYLAGRENNYGSKELLSFIDILIKETSVETIENFKQFMQMVVAYHKFHGKKQ